jgi:hypothetical protein
MKIKIYQIPEEKDRRDLMFRNYENAQSRGGVDLAEYDLVFDGEVEVNSLETVYCLFNQRSLIPQDYRGRSLSVSDIVETAEGFFFCDSVGFVELKREGAQ